MLLEAWRSGCLVFGRQWSPSLPYLGAWADLLQKGPPARRAQEHPVPPVLPQPQVAGAGVEGAIGPPPATLKINVFLKEIITFSGSGGYHFRVLGSQDPFGVSGGDFGVPGARFWSLFWDPRTPIWGSPRSFLGPDLTTLRRSYNFQ